MQISRIPKIKGYRVFRDMAWPDDLHSFGKFNLIYGWNASGKTTLSTLFRHVQDREAVSEGDVRFEIDNRVVKGADFADAVMPEVRVFNAESVRKSVFEDPRGQLPPVYYLGEDSVEKQEYVKQLKLEHETANGEKVRHEEARKNAESNFERFCTDRAREIKNLLTVPGGGAYNDYNSRLFKAKAGQLLSQDPTFTMGCLDDQTRSRHLATKSGNEKPKVSASQSTFPGLRGLVGETSNVLERTATSRQLEEMIADKVLESWVGQGLQLHDSDAESQECRFCKGNLSGQRLRALQGHFSAEFRELQSDLNDLLDSVRAAQSQINELVPPVESLLYHHLLGKYGEAKQNLADSTSTASELLAAVEAALLKKREQPLQRMNLQELIERGCSPKANELLKSYEGAPIRDEVESDSFEDPGQTAWQNIQAVIQEHNQHTALFSKELSIARRALEEDEIRSVLKDFVKMKSAIQTEEKEVEKLDQRLQPIGGEIAAIETQIREHRRPAEELNSEIASYLGRSDLTLATEESGYTIKRDGDPATNLSESERTAIAFMYFLKSLSDTGFVLQNGIVVIDDPISSLDANSLFSAFGYMQARTAEAGQLFVLTHNFSFFRQVREWFGYLPKEHKPARFFMIDCRYRDGVRAAILKPLDSLLKDYQTEYHFLFSQIHQDANSQEPHLTLDSCYCKPNMARRLLEAFLAFRFPAQAGELTKQLRKLDMDPATRARILRFLHSFSHHGHIAEPQHDPSILSETRAILRDILCLIESVDPKHYEGMVELVGTSKSASPGDSAS